MGQKRQDETTEQFKIRRAEYMRLWTRKKVARLLTSPDTPLCGCGCGDKVTSAFRGAKYANGHWTLGKEFGTTKQAERCPTIMEIHWIAGFLEGEGSFTASRGSNGYPTARVEANQNQKEPLEKLHRLLGGSLRRRGGKTVRFKNRSREYEQRDYWSWYAHQARARGIMMTVYSLMSPRRQDQIRNVFAAWKRNGHSTTWNRRRQKLA